jgi:hypothetical protein
MASDYSPELRIELIANGAQAGTWGTSTNNNLGTLIEDAIASTATVTTASADQALTIQNGAKDQARCAALVLNTSASLATGVSYNVYAPPVSKLYVVKNVNTSNPCTLYASSVAGNTTPYGSGVTIPPLGSALVRCDGVNMVEQLSSISGNLAIGGTLTVGGTTSFTGNTVFGAARLSATYTQGSGSTTATFLTNNTYVAGVTQVYVITVSGPFVSGVYTVATASPTNFSITTTAPSSAISGSALITNDIVTINGVLNAGTVIDGSSTIPALRVTQTGTGNALEIDDAANPDSTPFIIDTNGRVIVGNTTSLSAFSANGLNPYVQEIGTDANTAALGVALFSTAQIGPTLELARAYSTGSIGTFTAVPANALLGTVNFSAADGAKFRPAATIRGVTNATASTTSAPAYLSLSTIPALSTDLIERLRVNSDGNIILGAGEATATTTGNTLRGPNRTGTNAIGTGLTIAAGNGTGTGGSGSITLQTAGSGTAGTAQSTMIDRLAISPTGFLSAKYDTMATTSVPSEAIYRLSTDYAPAATSNQISMFGVGIPLAANTTYEIEAFVGLYRGTVESSRHYIFTGFNAGSGTISNMQYWVSGAYVFGIDASFNTLPRQAFVAYANIRGGGLFGVVPTSDLTFMGGPYGSPNSYLASSLVMSINGIFTIGTAGIFTPKYLTSSDAVTPTGGAYGPYKTVAGSYIKIRALTTDTSATVNVGGWV